MAGILKNCGLRRNGSSVSFLVVGPVELCLKITEGLNQSIKGRKWRITVHQCETVVQVVNSNLNLGIDFIIFAFDWRTSQSLTEVEISISLVDEYYIVSGASCLVNCSDISNVMGLTFYTSRKIRDKYNIRFMSAKVSKPEDCVQLGDRILNLAESIFGILSGIPVIGPVIQYN